MKVTVLLVVAISAATSLAAAERVDLQQLPPAVKKTIDDVARSEPVKEITVRHARERAVYDVELERRSAPNPHVRIAETGEVISDTRNVPPTEAVSLSPDAVPASLPRLRLAELPTAAQQTIQHEAAGREIDA